jgi:sterol desaturase/sphingolipid hydroxylase (fatty acid hydroxylase superfamily)
MAKLFVSNKDESVRIFRNDILDKLSRIHFSVPLYLYVPLALYCMIKSLFVYEQYLLFIPLVALGIFMWTFTEYTLHRFVFHYQPKSKIGQRIHFITHGVHHDYPNDSKRLVMVPAISLPLCAIFYTLFYLILGQSLVDGFFVGYLVGYLFYDISHYALHHFNFKSKFWLELKQHHMRHHYVEPENGFGVSTKFWDHVFRTMFKK